MRPRLIGHKDKLMLQEDLDRVLDFLDRAAVTGRPMPHYVAQNRARGGDEQRRTAWPEFWQTSRIAVRIFVQSGLRCAELASLTVADCDIGSRPYRLLVRGGKKRRQDEVDAVMIPQALADDLEEWIALQELEDDDYIIRNRRGTQCDRRWIYELAKAPMRACGLNPKYATHHYRHRYATTLLKQSGGNLLMVQQQLRHRSLQPTSAYLHMVDYEESAMEAVDRMGIGAQSDEAADSRSSPDLGLHFQLDEEQRRRQRRKRRE